MSYESSAKEQEWICRNCGCKHTGAILPNVCDYCGCSRVRLTDEEVAAILPGSKNREKYLCDHELIKRCKYRIFDICSRKPANLECIYQDKPLTEDEINDLLGEAEKENEPIYQAVLKRTCKLCHVECEDGAVLCPECQLIATEVLKEHAKNTTFVSEKAEHGTGVLRTCPSCKETIVVGQPMGEDKLCYNCWRKSAKDIGKAKLQKRDWTLLPFDALEEVIKVREFGNKKHGGDTWKDVEPFYEVYIQAAFRHLIAYANGEDFDPESGLSHMAHLACNALFMLWKDKKVGK